MVYFKLSLKKIIFASNYTRLYITHILLMLLKQARCAFFSLYKVQSLAAQGWPAALIIPENGGSVQLSARSNPVCGICPQSQKCRVTSLQKRRGICQRAKAHSPETAPIRKTKQNSLSSLTYKTPTVVSPRRRGSHGRTRSRKGQEEHIFNKAHLCSKLRFSQ